ncbi:MAG: ShlB/FhaC/HecB family hemolysin secretion/activation protein [Chlamydiae bacterium]|nr:ShlB/FhaC/HecB family hemolysin secretion/activation protein [Chlamydiota bacterium]
MKYFLSIFLFVVTLFAEESPVLVNQAKSLILVGDEETILNIDTQIQGLVVYDLDIPGSIEELKNKIAPIFLDKDLTKEVITKIENEISLFFKQNNRPFVAVNVPEQEIKNNTLILVVSEAKINNIYTVNNKWTKRHVITNHIKLKKNDVINDKTLANNIFFINKNPFRRVDLIYTPGKKVGTTDLELMVYDRFPLRVYAGYDNTGLRAIGRNRWMAGFNWNNICNLDQTLYYQYTSSNDMRQFQSHTGQYTYYLPWNHVFSLFGGYSTVHANHFNLFLHHSATSQASLRYDFPLPVYRHIYHDFSFGFDFKRSNTFVEFNNASIHTANKVNLTQLVFLYDFHYLKKIFKADFDLEVYYSPARIFSDQTNKKFSNLRLFARNQYIYSRATVSALWDLKKHCHFLYLVRGQLSSNNLLPSEEFGLGGYNSVRGYYEREVNVDRAILQNFEFWFPPFKIIKHSYKTQSVDGLMPILFLDYGVGAVHKAQVGEKKVQYLIGYGPGLRFTMNPYITARFDVGLKAHQKTGFGGGIAMVHFAVTASY